MALRPKPYTLQAIKKDGDTDAVMADVKFALHRLITVGGVTKYDDNPMPDYESLVTDADGVIPKIDNTLSAGTYWLKETTPAGYEGLSGFIRFTVSDTGEISLIETSQERLPEGTSLNRTEGSGGTLSYEMTIENYKKTDITLKKVDDKNHDLTGSTFELCKYDGSSWATPTAIDLTNTPSIAIKNLGPGRYRLKETKAPDGYNILTSFVYFNISFNSSGPVVTLTSEDGESTTYDNASVSGTTITVKNTPGSALPNTGGPGTTVFTLVGTLMIAAGITMGVRRRIHV